MIFVVIIFFIAIITAYGMLAFRAWELRTGQVDKEIVGSPVQHLSLRQIEKIMLYLLKHFIQGVVILVVKYWFIAITKISVWLKEKWPKVSAIFEKKPESTIPKKPSFITKAVLESKSKIKRLKQKIREEHAVESE
ncbi:MAG: hypothetical protein NTX85_03940 [Candidatus Nomurabacteria bacterium]|nr:hypothetical protein [Candidatus Nomurabacteria bacterium]